MWDTIVEATTGRGELRLLLQPVVAALFGVRLGLTGARPSHELRSALVALVIAIVIDAYLQIFVHGQMRWIAAVVVGTALIFIPYGIARSVAQRLHAHAHPSHAR